jgi:hypothetical protein
VLGVLKTANLRAPGVLLIFQDRPASPAAQFAASIIIKDVPRHIYGLFQALGIQYRWVLPRGTLGRELVKAEDLAIDDTKEESWMAVYEHERDLLEDTVLLYRRLVSKWSEFSDAYAVFDQHNPIQLCTVSRCGKLFSLLSLSSTSACKLSFLPVRSDAL